jgi:hypothetical protein
MAKIQVQTENGHRLRLVKEPLDADNQPTKDSQNNQNNSYLQ